MNWHPLYDYRGGVVTAQSLVDLGCPYSVVEALDACGAKAPRYEPVCLAHNSQGVGAAWEKTTTHDLTVAAKNAVLSSSRQACLDVLEMHLMG